jgi:hypothetical protein
MARIHFEKLIVAQLIEWYLSFMEPKGLLPQSQQPFARACPETS